MDELVPSKFYLSQNFPNPFGRETQIKYCLPVRTFVQLSVFCFTGEKVRELLNEVKNAGTYEIKFDPLNLPDGYYYYEIKAHNLESRSEETFIETKQMVLQR